MTELRPAIAAVQIVRISVVFVRNSCAFGATIGNVRFPYIAATFMHVAPRLFLAVSTAFVGLSHRRCGSFELFTARCNSNISGLN